MDKTLIEIESKVYNPCGLKIVDYKKEAESKEYEACKFTLNGKHIISRTAKITPKKIGQFVTFWKRNGNGPIEPFNETDEFDFYIINLQTETKHGQFVFPKSILIKKGIVSTQIKEGKRGFRVYPSWDVPTSKQAIRSQKWQLDYFYEVKELADVSVIKRLYNM